MATAVSGYTGLWAGGSRHRGSNRVGAPAYVAELGGRCVSLTTFSEERKNDVQNFPSQVGYSLRVCEGRVQSMSTSALSPRQEIQPAALVPDSPRDRSGEVRLVMQWVVGTVLAFLIGSWLVWWAINLQRQFSADEIKDACQRVMPETVQRCVDTVIIQRGVARR